MNKKVYFFIDDVIWPFRDLTRDRPASIFEQRWLKILKEAHDRFGLKVALNAFYRTDYFYGDEEFTLADMTDAYKAEWEANADWLKIGFHAKQEFPDYPHVNIDYEDMKNQYLRFEKEVKRFAGEKTLSTAFNPHWSPVSREGIQALSDCGVLLSCVTSGDLCSFEDFDGKLPYGVSARLKYNRKPETAIWTRSRPGSDKVSAALSGYNHISTEDDMKTLHTTKMFWDEGTKIYFKKFFTSVLLNGTPIENIKDVVRSTLKGEYSCFATHEQYAYPHYYGYQANTREKLFAACEVYEEEGYEYIFIEDLIPTEKK